LHLQRKKAENHHAFIFSLKEEENEDIKEELEPEETEEKPEIEDDYVVQEVDIGNVKYETKE
jgi:hypothetical protein